MEEQKERRKAVNAKESLQDEYPTPEIRHRETNQMFAIVILSCMFLVVTIAWVVNMKDRASKPPIVVIRGQGVKETIIGEGRYVIREDTFTIDKDTGKKYHFVLLKGNTE